MNLRARQIATVAALTVLGGQPQLRAHVRSGLNVGVPRHELVEVLIQMAVHAGWPRALEALHTTRDLFRGIDRAADPGPTS